jgi:hypothetical protein
MRAENPVLEDFGLVRPCPFPITMVSYVSMRYQEDSDSQPEKKIYLGVLGFSVGIILYFDYFEKKN